MLIRGRMRRGLTSNGRGFSAFFYGVSPSNPLAIEAAARVRRSHATSFARFPKPKQAKFKIDRSGAQCHAF